MLSPVFDTPIISNDQSLDRVLAAGLPVMLVFLDGAAAPPLEETLNRLARSHAGQALVVKIPLRDNPAAARRFAVERAPTVVTVQQGQVKSKAQTASAPDLEKHLLYLLGKGPKPEPSAAAGNGAASRPAAGTRHAPPVDHAASTGRPQTVTDATFERDVLQSSQPVLVDFWAPWCGPCRMTEPILEKLAREMAGRLRIAKVNVDENPASAQRYGVQSIPTMLLVQNGRIVDRWVGAQPEQAIRSRIAPVVR